MVDSRPFCQNRAGINRSPAFNPGAKNGIVFAGAGNPATFRFEPVRGGRKKKGPAQSRAS